VENYDLTITTQNPEGYVHIEDVRFPFAVGGIRLITGVDKEEVKALATAMSLKLHIFGFPMSGAKGGINSDNINDLYEFVSDPQIKELVTGNNSNNIQLITGPDIGTSEEEYYVALRKAGLDHIVRKGLLSQNSEIYGLPLDNIVTAYGVVVAARELLRSQNRDLFDGEVKYVIEGFGKVGTGIAAILKSKAKLLGVSTRYGSIVNDEGFDIDTLINKQSEIGDRLVNDFDNKADTTSLFEIPCDLIIPGARTGVITEEIANRIVDKAKPIAIVPVSNSPYTTRGLEILQKNGIICFPDFLASAGAVIAAMIEFAGAGGEKEAMALVESAISKETRDLISDTQNTTGSLRQIYEVAYEKSLRRKKHIIQNLDISGSFVDVQKLAREIINRYMLENK
jgi:glutamate dehydrogenase